MGVSTRCTGRNLYNYLKQKNVAILVNYNFNKDNLTWGGTLTVYDVTYKVSKKTSKQQVLEHLMQDAESFIYSNISVKNCH